LPSVIPQPAAPARESSIRTVSALAIAMANREADAIAHNAAGSRASTAGEPRPGLAVPIATSSPDAREIGRRFAVGGPADGFAAIDLIADHAPGVATAEPAYDAITIDPTAGAAGGVDTDPPGPDAAIEVFEIAMADIAHDPPPGASTAIARTRTGGTTAALLGTPIVATHRVPAGLARNVPAGVVTSPAPSITLMPVVDPSANPRTPLEQAVHDLIGRLGQNTDDQRESRSSPTSELCAEQMLVQIPSPPQPVQIAHAAPASEPARTGLHTRPPEPPANPSHVHLVVDDGPERVVVTVAMRGNDVHVALRGSDDATTAAFARNAATLDHAMRARGLTLGEVTIEREPQQRSRHQSEPPPPPPRHQPDAEPFELEDTP
jgi:hypothetical protein